MTEFNSIEHSEYRISEKSESLKDHVVVKVDKKFDYSNMPKAMKALNQWVPWALVRHKDSSDKPKKSPIIVKNSGVITGCSSVEPKADSWYRHLSFDGVCGEYEKHGEVVGGVGFCCYDSDGIIFIDFDHVDESIGEDGEYVDYRMKVVDEWKDKTFVERSMSGHGYHIFIKGKLNGGNHDSNGSGLEIYNHARFCAITCDFIGTGWQVGDGVYGGVDGVELIDVLVGKWGLYGNKRGEFEKAVKHAIHKKYQQIINDGEGREWNLYKYAQDMFDRGIELNVAREAIQRINRDFVRPPREENYADDKVVRAYREKQSRIDTIIGGAGLELLDKYCYVQSEHRYQHVNGASCLQVALNNAYIKKGFTGKKMDVDGVKMPLAHDYFMSSSDSIVVDKVFWKPMKYHRGGGGYIGRSVRDEGHVFTRDGVRYVNEWTDWPFNCDRYDDPLERSEGTDDLGYVRPWLDLAEHLVEEEDYRRRLIQWCAFTIREVDVKINWQIVMHGVSGAGKNFLFKPLCKMLGSSGRDIGCKGLDGAYDDALIGTKLGVVGEMDGSAKNMEKIKEISAESSDEIIKFNRKKEHMIDMYNCISIVVLSNHFVPIDPGNDNRRFFVLKANKCLNDEKHTELRKRCDAWLNREDGAIKLMHYLMWMVDLSDFNHKVMPYQTTHSIQMGDDAKENWEHMLRDMLETGTGFFEHDLVSSQDMFSYLNLNGAKVKNRATIEHWLSDNGYHKYQKQIQSIGKKAKSFCWHYKKGSKFDNVLHSMKYSTVWDAVDLIERLGKKSYQ